MLPDQGAGFQIPFYEVDPWIAVRLELGDAPAPEIVDPALNLQSRLRGGGWPMEFEHSLQEATWSGPPFRTGCTDLASDFGVVYAPRASVTSSRGRPPSELAAYYLFRNGKPLTVEAFCKTNVLLGGPGSLRRHEHRTSQYPSGHRVVFMPVDRVPDETERLIERVNGENGIDAFKIAVAALVHCLSIHPFSDANGRTSNLIFQYCLFRHGVLRLPLLPLGPYLQKHRAEWLHVLITFAVKHTLRPAYEFLTLAVQKTSASARQLLGVLSD